MLASLIEREARDTLRRLPSAGNIEEGHREIDIIGVSRGAALAVHFANQVARDGIRLIRN